MAENPVEDAEICSEIVAGRCARHSPRSAVEVEILGRALFEPEPVVVGRVL